MSEQVVGTLDLAHGRRPIVRILAARALECLSWLGIAGIALTTVGAIWLGSAWDAHQKLARAVTVRDTALQPRVEAPRPPPIQPVRPRLTKLGEAHRLPAGLALAARSSGLGWPAADYRIIEATPDRMATLEVRCTLKGPYPNLRRFLAQVLNNLPGATIRELQMSRPSSEAHDVDARLVLQVFLDDETTVEAMPTMAGARP